MSQLRYTSRSAVSCSRICHVPQSRNSLFTAVNNLKSPLLKYFTESVKYFT
jgi:hypothetical protein